MSKEVIDKKVEELAKEAAAAGSKEKKQDVKVYYLGPAEAEAAGKRQFVEGVTALVAKTDYNLLAGENKALKRELQKLADLVDQKNIAIDQMVDEKQTVALSLYEEKSARLEMCRKKLKKLGAYGGE